MRRWRPGVSWPDDARRALAEAVTPKSRNTYNRLAGKRAIITGGGGADGVVGIGRAISELFALEGASVCVVDRESARADYTVEEIRGAGGAAFAIVADVTEASACVAIVQTVAEAFGGVDVLVNNVGVSGGEARSMAELDISRWDEILRVNLRSAALMTGAAVASMLGTGGSIVNIASIGGLMSHGSGPGYSPSKAAMIALTREVAVMHGRDAIRCNALAPGHVWTSHVSDIQGEDVRRWRRDAAPLGIEGDAWDVASAALFLASDDARFVSGVCLPVDGGLTPVAPLAAFRFLSG